MDAQILSLELKLEQAQQELLRSLQAEQRYADQSREHRAEMVNGDLTYHQRESHQRLHVQFAGQYTGQRRESERLRYAIGKLQRLVQEARDLRQLSDQVLMSRMNASAPVALTHDQCAGMDECGGIEVAA